MTASLYLTHFGNISPLPPIVSACASVSGLLRCARTGGTQGRGAGAAAIGAHHRWRPLGTPLCSEGNANMDPTRTVFRTSSGRVTSPTWGPASWWAHLLHVDRRPRSGWLQGWQPVERLNRQTHAAAACSLVRGQARLAGSNGGTRGVTTRLAKLALEDPVAPKHIARPR